ncbi:uncharacterized protein LOC111382828 isoform X3 [Olea europaea var. sylvestris]|uniref:uncharacterized protein LOC111382828 isoform X3 n=1 Tax=Olea europaea var. sylvestris TaxID=158386 RepID=UPI000C1D7EF8|nr:uncharacterized protein LOC111382828 isoform X3 [Olea europaea var. sylvestris]
MDASKKKLVVQAREGDMHISGKFDVDLNDQQMVEIVERHCCERYKEHRSACNKKYKQLKLDEKDPLQCRPSTVKSQEDWEWMCAHFESDKLLLGNSIIRSFFIVTMEGLDHLPQLGKHCLQMKN